MCLLHFLVHYIPYFLLACIILKYLPLFTPMKCPWTGKNAHWFQKLFFGNLLWFGQYWNDFQVHGMENIAANNCLLVGYHSRCTLDLCYVNAALRPNIIASHMFFSFPPFLYFLRALNIYPSKGRLTSTTTSTFLDIIQQDRPLLLIPGGAYEFAKDTAHRYVVDWKAAPGFARALLEEADRPGRDTKVVPFHVRNCEEVYYTSSTWFDFSGRTIRYCLEQIKEGHVLYIPYAMSLALLSLGLFVFPRPIPLHLYIGAPLTALPNESPEQFASRVREALQALIDRTQALPEPQPPSLSISAAIFKYGVFAPYMLLQNILMTIFIFGITLIFVPVSLLFVLAYQVLFPKCKKIE